MCFHYPDPEVKNNEEIGELKEACRIARPIYLRKSCGETGNSIKAWNTLKIKNIKKGQTKTRNLPYFLITFFFFLNVLNISNWLSFYSFGCIWLAEKMFCSSVSSMKKNLNIVYLLLLCKIENCVDVYMKFDGKVEIICTCNGLSFLLILSMHKQQITQKLTKKALFAFWVIAGVNLLIDKNENAFMSEQVALL